MSGDKRSYCEINNWEGFVGDVRIELALKDGEMYKEIRSWKGGLLSCKFHEPGICAVNQSS